MMSSTPSVKDSDSISSSAEPLYQVRLLTALRTGDPALIHPFLADLGREKKRISTSGDQRIEPVDLGGAALHLAIRVASCETVQLLLSHRSVSPNALHPPGTGTTPLHLAASLGRANVVELLLDQEGIDDTLRDSKGRSCKYVAKGKETLKVIQDSQALLTASYRSLLHTYISSPSPPPTSPTTGNASSAPPALLALLVTPRIKLVDLSYLDPTTGTTLLHEAARRRDSKLLELAIKAGADVFVRDIRGKGVGHGLGKDERIRVMLRQYTNQDTTLMDEAAPLSGPPELKGYLNKYTNVARGYNTRWFVLKDGILSYYRHQQDESVASRGSIAMKAAAIKVSQSASNNSGGGGADKLRFEVYSLPAPQGHGQAHAAQRWFLKANHPIEIARWTQALAKSIEWAGRLDADNSDAGSVYHQQQHPHAASSSASASTRGNTHTRRQSVESVGARSVSSSMAPSMQRKRTSSISGALRRKLTGAGANPGGSGTDVRMSEDSVPPVPPVPVMTQRRSEDTGNDSDANGLEPSFGGRQPSGSADEGGDEDEDDAVSRWSGGSASAHPPHNSEFTLHGEATTTQLALTAQLLDQLALPPSSSVSSLGAGSMLGSSRLTELKTALRESLGQVSGMLDEYVKMVGEREDWYRARLARERERGKVWEESLAVVVKEGEDLERELKERFGNRRRSRMGTLTVTDAGATVRLREKTASPPIVSPPLRTSSASTSIAGTSIRSEATTAFADAAAASTDLTPTVERAEPPTVMTPRASTIHTFSLAIPPTAPSAGDNDSLEDEDDDEFFDAIESNTLPNLTVNNALLLASSTRSSSTITDSTTAALASANKLDLDQYEGYKHMRERLPIDNDKRPSTSLWSVLKHNIGKDLTKITFPVSFNEPTSMLQRMAEDMEFSECLDAAAAESEPQRRIAFVAAFAMSNYSSTIGRIAKPFNPMLGETFEYVRLDKGYRYMSEQVSHHPPMSACWAEAPSWHYYGEVDAKNKFMGKSFEIRPTGVAHAELLLPEELGGDDYPHITGVDGNTKAVEHYSWKKVTTNVSGFILGSPTIDHYGDMIVTNHRTGDKCILTFKPRGWRGADAFEIQGKILDASGGLRYEIAGRWNSQLVARAVGKGTGYLLPDVQIGGSGPASPSADPEYILLWRNTEKPVAPFNLTPFAITLNDCPDSLKVALPPTDCRLRPDQRAFEIGEYDKANELKGAQEDLQRQTRKLREEGKLPPHSPRWFEATTEVDTGERVWVPARIEEKLEYWAQREQVWKTSGAERWKDVEDIFIPQD